MTRLRLLTVAFVVALAAVAGVTIRAQGAVPGVPANLTYQVDNRAVYLNWTNSTGVVSFYRLEAGGSPGTTFFTFDSNVLVDPSKLPQLLSSFATGGVGNGNYYVRVRAANGAGFSEPSNEVIVPITGGCQAPAAPADVTAITRGTNVFLAWNAGSGGRPTAYTLHASYTPGGPVIAAMTGSQPFVNVGAVPVGVYYVRVYAHTACATSGPSTEIVVNVPVDSPARTPNAASGRLPWFAVQGLVQIAQQEAIARGFMNGGVACPTRPGYSDSDIEARKTQRNAFIDHVVARLRQFDQRFGYNAKPTRAPFAQIAGDEIAYHWGSDASEGSPNVYLTDVLGGHCTFGRESADYRTFTNEYGRWTGAGVF